MNNPKRIMIALLLSFVSLCSHADLKVAVASNFKVSTQHIVDLFSAQYGVNVSLSSASTTTLYQQILRGAPFDLFLSADKKHVDLLAKEAIGADQTSFVYAQGRLVFWYPTLPYVPTLNSLGEYTQRLAIANPKFAPYGIAAKEALIAAKRWPALSYIKGNNINQAYQFVETRNVAAGVVSYASVIQQQQTQFVLIPQAWHGAILQSGLVLNNGNVAQAKLFKEFLLSADIQAYIKSQGYH